MVVTLALTSYHLLIGAIVFFALIAEWRNDALYWFMCFIMSLYILFNRPDNSIIPVSVFVGWIFIVLYQMAALVMNKKAKNLSGDE